MIFRVTVCYQFDDVYLVEDVRHFTGPFSKLEDIVKSFYPTGSIVKVEEVTGNR